MIDRKLGRNLYRKIITGPLEQHENSSQPRPHHFRSQSSTAESLGTEGRVSSDSASALAKKRRGSSDSILQSRSPKHHRVKSHVTRHRGVRSIINRYEAVKKRRSKSERRQVESPASNNRLARSHDEVDYSPEGALVSDTQPSEVYDQRKKFWVSRQERKMENAKRDYYEVGHSALPGSTAMEKEKVRRELAEIEQMGVVANRHSRRLLKNHIHQHISRMSNHRVTIRSGSGVERKKSSVLVTMEDTEEQEREINRQRRNALIETFLQAPSRKQRVLQRLCSKPAVDVDGADQAKRRHHLRRQLRLKKNIERVRR